MRFSSGMLGALIITLALMGTVAMGFMSSVEKVNTTSIEYDYLTDATSLFSYSTDPEYVDYSPNINYTHYSTSFDMANTGSGATFYTSGISYTQTANSLVNPYRVYTQAETTVNNITLTSALSTLSGSGNSNNHTLLGAHYTYFGSNYVMFDQADYQGCYVSSLASVITHSSISNTSNIHTFRFDDNSSPWVIYGSNVRWEDVVINSSTNLHRNILRSNESDCTFGAPTTPSYAIYDSISNEITVYRADGYALFTGNPSNVYVVFGGTNNNSTSSHAPGTTLRVETVATQPPTYMDISQGVSLTANTVYWGNGYDVGKVSMILKAPTSSASLTIDGRDATGGAMGSVSITYGTSGFSIGDWDAILLIIDYVNGTYTINGVSNVVSMTDYLVSNYRSTGSFTSSGVPHVLKFISSDVGAWLFNIASTTVYTNNSTQVMQNPSINLDAYFLNEPYLRLNLSSFAYYGTSITVNGHTYTVTDGKITLYADGRTRSYELANTYIVWEDGTVYLTFNNSNVTVDLGEYTTKSVSMAGSWYFTASVYEGKQVSSHHWEYNFGEWDMSQAAFILFFIGLLIVAAAIIHVKRGLRGIDMVALIIAGLTAYLLLT